MKNKKREQKKNALVILCAWISSTLLFSCGYSNQSEEEELKTNDVMLINRNMQDSSIKTIKEKSDKYFLLDKLTVILFDDLNTNSNYLNIQYFTQNGRSFIPVFSSPDKFKESTKGVDLGKEIIEINPYLLLSVVNGKETLRMNPSLPDEIYFNASDLQQIYKSEIDSLLKKMQK